MVEPVPVIGRWCPLPTSMLDRACFNEELDLERVPGLRVTWEEAPLSRNHSGVGLERKPALLYATLSMAACSQEGI